MNILMVCLGNICRSPMAEGILKAKIKKHQLDWYVDSAGTSDWHIGETPDLRAVQTTKQYGVDISSQRSRQFTPSDFDRFHLILTMDQENYDNVVYQARSSQDREKVKMILDYLYPGQSRAIPDPYFDNRFNDVYRMLDQACDQIITTHHDQ